MVIINKSLTHNKLVTNIVLNIEYTNSSPRQFTFASLDSYKYFSFADIEFELSHNSSLLSNESDKNNKRLAYHLEIACAVSNLS